MSFAEAAILGSISGLTIFLGLPVARVRVVAPKHIAFLNALAIGILFFLFVDIMHRASEPVEAALKAGAAELPVLLALLLAGFTAGLLSLVFYAARVLRTPALSAARLALLIALGIGMHNFSEGLAIGSSAQKGELALAFTLIVGFALHNATEGFGIAAPLAGERVGWGLLVLAGVIGGGPSFLGTIVGYSVTSDALAVLFLAVAGGALVFVLGELFAAGRRLGAPVWSGWGIAVGFAAGLLTDLGLVALGA